jgi:hypothetical protein
VPLEGKFLLDNSDVIYEGNVKDLIEFFIIVMLYMTESNVKDLIEFFIIMMLYMRVMLKI